MKSRFSVDWMGIEKGWMKSLVFCRLNGDRDWAEGALVEDESKRWYFGFLRYCWMAWAGIFFFGLF